VLAACAAPRTVPSPPAATASPALLDRAAQLVVVTTPGWDATTGTLRRYERRGGADAWHAVGAPVAIVVGRTGLAWDDAVVAPASEPRKREGDGKSPAGLFPVDTAFGFAARDAVPWVRLQYVALTTAHECVDDAASAHYNTVVARTAVPRVDWSSAERMRAISVYRLGAIIGYNAPPRAGRGSCIFFHVWDGPQSVTAGCTAMEESALRDMIAWLDPKARPAVVQLTAGAYAARRDSWRLP
jgi:zinc D-Ala-D-Ala dipeptidase